MKSIHKVIIVCALGYFVDIFDIQLFAVLRQASLKDLGIRPEDMANVGGNILTAQMLGMILGAFLWGWLGDRFGRLQALLGSILIYSAGTMACALVQDVYTYGLLRFITGFGLAGETGAAITLVSELMTKQNRTWGVTVVAGFGTFGPVAAVLLAGLFDWRTTYLIAGLMGIGLLFLRTMLSESNLFLALKSSNDVVRGPLYLFSKEQRPWLLRCILVGLPGIYAFSLLNFFSLEFAAIFVKDGEFLQRTALICFYIGFGLGDCASGIISQLMKSRKQAILLFLSAGALLTACYFALGWATGFSSSAFYLLYLGFGVIAGYWMLFSLLAAEHFGTNIRTSGALVCVNLIRGFTIIMVPFFTFISPLIGFSGAALLIGIMIYAAAFWAWRQLRETHNTSLDYT